MISIIHPLVRKVEQEYSILHSLVDDLPFLYDKMAREIDELAKADAEDAANGDDDIYRSVYNAYLETIGSIYEVPNQSRGYLLAAIYAFYERNVQCVFKELGVIHYEKESVTTHNVFDICGLSIGDHQELYTGIDSLGLIRNNLSHGRLNKKEHWDRLNEYVVNNGHLEMNDDVVFIKDDEYLFQSLDIIMAFFETVFASNSAFTRTVISS